MTRRKDWPSRFAALVEEARLRPFEWGVHDCCLWAADSVLALTGVDHALGLRGTYADALAARRVLDALGGYAGAAALAGPEIAPALAGAGDVGLVASGAEDGVSLGVCTGIEWLCVGDAGLLRFPLASAQRAWRVA